MRNLVFAAISVLGLAACGSDGVDLTPPTIDEVGYSPMPQPGEICGATEPVVFELKGGDEFDFDVLFEDDKGLTQYKIDIHNNFDCHGHGGGVAPKVVVPSVDNQTEDWSVLKIEDLSGTSVSVQESLKVPANVTAGNYHFHLQVIDESGNDSPFSNFYSLKIRNASDDVAPQIAVTEPASTLSLQRGETLTFKGQVTDNYSLSEGGNGVLYLAYTKLSSGNTFSTDVAFPFDATVDKSYDFDFNYTIPRTLTAGDYRFSIGANDGVRNVAPFVFFDVAVQ